MKPQAYSTAYPLKTPLINVMTAAAHKAARGLIRDYGEIDNLQVSRKGAANFVSDADLRAEKSLKADLGKARPKFGMLLEESGEVGDPEAEYRWVVDPLDGTNNFLHAVPFFCISIGVERRLPQGGSEMVAGVIYDPIHDEMFMAEKGNGAYVNQRRLRCASRGKDLYFVAGTSRIESPYTPLVNDLTANAAKLDSTMRRTGSAALDLAYVAAGRIDACWFAHVQKWDMAAGIVMVLEAGGMVVTPGDKLAPYDTGCVLASSHEAYESLSGCIPKRAA